MTGPPGTRAVFSPSFLQALWLGIFLAPNRIIWSASRPATSKLITCVSVLVSTLSSRSRTQYHFKIQIYAPTKIIHFRILWSEELPQLYASYNDNATKPKKKVCNSHHFSLSSHDIFFVLFMEINQSKCVEFFNPFWDLCDHVWAAIIYFLKLTIILSALFALSFEAMYWRDESSHHRSAPLFPPSYFHGSSELGCPMFLMFLGRSHLCFCWSRIRSFGGLTSCDGYCACFQIHPTQRWKGRPMPFAPSKHFYLFLYCYFEAKAVFFSICKLWSCYYSIKFSKFLIFPRVVSFAKKGFYLFYSICFFVSFFLIFFFANVQK